MGYYHSIVHFKTCNQDVVTVLKESGYNEKKIKAFTYTQKSQKTYSELYDIPLIGLIPRVFQRIIQNENPHLIREFIFYFDFQHIFLVRSQQFTTISFSIDKLKENEKKCNASAKSLRAVMCQGGESCKVREIRLMTQMRSIVVISNSLYKNKMKELNEIAGTYNSSIRLPQKIRWNLYKNLQFLVSSTNNCATKEVSHIVLLTNALRLYSKELLTDIEEQLINYPNSPDMIKEIVMLYFWTNPEFIEKKTGVRINLKSWVRDCIVFRLKQGTQKQWDFRVIQKKLYNLSSLQFIELVKIFKRCNLNSLTDWIKTINPFAHETTDLGSSYSELNEIQKKILKEIYDEIRKDIRQGKIIGSQLYTNKFFTINQLAQKLNISGRGRRKFELELIELEKKGFLRWITPEDAPLRKAMVKGYYILNPIFPYHKYLFELVSEINR